MLALILAGTVLAASPAPSPSPSPGPPYPTVVPSLEVPFVPQTKDTCGAAALAMVMGYWGREVKVDDIAAGLLDRELRGIAGSKLATFARARGFRAIAYAGDLPHLEAFVAKGRPLVVAWKVGRNRFHDVVVVGLDAGRVLVHDPAVGASRAIERADFESRWAGAGHWTLLVLPEAP